MVFPISFVLALIFTGAVRSLAERVGLVDVPAPTPLKLHSAPTPLLGGAAVIAATAATAGFLQVLDAVTVLAATAALIVGLVDDRRPVSPLTRVVLLTGIGLAVAMALPIGFDVAAALGTIACMLVITNGVNLLDGQNGLAAGVAAIAAAGVAGVASDWRGTAIALAGALCGFLVWNFPTARIFLGNGGAYGVGAGLAALAALTAAPRGLSLVGPLLLCTAVPVAEVLSTVTRRWAAGLGMSGGDRFHGYDVLARGVGRSGSTLIVWTAAAGAAGAGIALRRSPEAAAGVAALVFAASMLAGYLAGMRLRPGETQ